MHKNQIILFLIIENKLRSTKIRVYSNNNAFSSPLSNESILQIKMHFNVISEI